MRKVEVYLVSVLYIQACKCSVHARMYTIAKRKSTVDAEQTITKWEFGLNGRVIQCKKTEVYLVSVLYIQACKCSVHAGMYTIAKRKSSVDDEQTKTK